MNKKNTKKIKPELIIIEDEITSPKNKTLKTTYLNIISRCKNGTKKYKP